MFLVSHLCFDRVKRRSSGWMAVASITYYDYIITNKFENLHALQRKINTRALLPDARPSRPILAVKKNHLYSSAEAEYSSTYWPTGLLYPGELFLFRTLRQLTVYWHPHWPWCPGPEKCLYKRSSLFLPSKESNECALKWALWLLNLSLNFVVVDPMYCAWQTLQDSK